MQHSITVELDQVTKRFGRIVAVNNVSLRLPDQGFVGLLGLNGSGKTTLLNLIAGLLRPTEGSIRLDGSRVTRQSGKQIAYVTDDQSLYGFYTIQETIGYAERVYPDFVRAAAEEIVTFLKFDVNKKVAQLSKGNKMRLNIAIALARRVPLLLMDEPLAGLDPLVREDILKMFVHFGCIYQKTIVISSHEVSEIEPYLDYAIFMKEGQMTLYASAEKIREEREQSMLNVMREYCV
ncbi:ABC-2 type transport system ATP-binding protein [Fontibacillus panacisegetis]|uniref:ABC-2 type transport system ATP-binding protein n=1 Tax=Fontibacillus panacisegetis TaxID=670482 RepID=A0A1G7GRR7_9BACL|nr:ABC transporter ATP-binding protein [Fontibacillus panacisegetis]SDE90814.1 ABC-2 type transport system ATP-binding protein [Fontibacillus panacisegetis]